MFEEKSIVWSSELQKLKTLLSSKGMPRTFTKSYDGQENIKTIKNTNEHSISSNDSDTIKN